MIAYVIKIKMGTLYFDATLGDNLSLREIFFKTEAYIEFSQGLVVTQSLIKDFLVSHTFIVKLL